MWVGAHRCVPQAAAQRGAALRFGERVLPGLGPHGAAGRVPDDPVSRGLEDGVSAIYLEDACCFFPKHSYARGIQEVTRLVMDVVPIYESLEHDVATFSFFVQGNTVVVEGTSRGTLAEAAGGGTWTETEGGRFCQVFECSGGKITRLHYYLDPDYAGRDTARYPWLADEASSIGRVS